MPGQKLSLRISFNALFTIHDHLHTSIHNVAKFTQRGLSSYFLPLAAAKAPRSVPRSDSFDDSSVIVLKQREKPGVTIIINALLAFYY